MKFTNEEKNKAWIEMNGILDKEMPVRKNKNRMFLILIFVLSGFIFLGKNYYFKEESEFSSAPDKSSVITPQTVNLSESSGQSNIPETSIESLTNSNLEPVLTSFNSNGPNGNNQFIEDNNIVNSKGPEVSGKEIIYLSSNAEYSGNQQREEEEKIKDEEIENIKTLLKSIPYQNIFSLDNLQINIIEQKNTGNILYFNPYIYCYIFNPDFSKFYPYFDLGIGNSILLSRKFYLDISLGIMDSRITYPEISLMSVGEADQLGSNAIFKYENKQTVTNYSIAKPFLYLSIFEGFRIHNTLSLKLGGGVLYTDPLNNDILSKNQEELGIENLDNSPEPEKSTNYTIDKQLVKRFTFYNEINLNYKINSGFSINSGMRYFYTNYDIYYDNYNNDIYKSSILKQPAWHYIYLGLQYNF